MCSDESRYGEVKKATVNYLIVILSVVLAFFACLPIIAIWKLSFYYVFLN